MATHMTAVGVFERWLQASRAVRELRRLGFREDQIGVVIPDGFGQELEAADDAAEFALFVRTTGVVGGAILGGMSGAVVGGLVPGVGSVFGAGVMATALSGAAAGAVAGGLVSALLDIGLPEEAAEFCDEQVRARRILVTVVSPDRHKEACRVLANWGGNTQFKLLSRDDEPARDSA